MASVTEVGLKKLYNYTLYAEHSHCQYMLYAHKQESGYGHLCDEITVQFPAEELSTTFQTPCDCFYDHNPVVAATSKRAFRKHNMLYCKRKT